MEDEARKIAERLERLRLYARDDLVEEAAEEADEIADLENREAENSIAFMLRLYDAANDAHVFELHRAEAAERRVATAVRLLGNFLADPDVQEAMDPGVLKSAAEFVGAKGE